MCNHTSGKKVKHIVHNSNIAPCTCNNFVLIVAPGQSSEAHLVSSAEYPAESTKKKHVMNKKRLWHREIGCMTCQNGWRNSRIIWCRQDQHLLGVTSEIPQNHLVHTVYQPRDQRESTICLRIVPEIQIVKYASIRKLQEQVADEILKVTYASRQSSEIS